MLAQRPEPFAAFKTTNRVGSNACSECHCGFWRYVITACHAASVKSSEALINSLNQLRNVLSGNFVRGHVRADDIADVNQ